MNIIISIAVMVSIITILILLIRRFDITAADILNVSLLSSHYKQHSNISYGADKQQTLDLYTPTIKTDTAEGNNKPIIVFVFGSVWRHGDKKTFRFIAHAFTRLGYRVVIPNYRFYPAVKFPLFIDDIAMAITTMERHEETLVGDLSQGIILIGHSSGAHTAALLATDQHYFQQQKIKTPLKALIGLAGPYDLSLDHAEVTPIFQPISDEKTVKPVQQVHRAMPPVLLLHGLKDTRVKPFHSQRFIEALKHKNIPHQLKLYDNVSHIGILSSIAAPLRRFNNSYADIRTFLATLT